jgi:hypothetical protein
MKHFFIIFITAVFMSIAATCGHAREAVSVDFFMIIFNRTVTGARSADTVTAGSRATPVRTGVLIVTDVGFIRTQVGPGTLTSLLVGPFITTDAGSMSPASVGCGCPARNGARVGFLGGEVRSMLVGHLCHLRLGSFKRLD